MNQRTEVERIAATWILKRDSGNWTVVDAKELSAWLDQSPSHRAAYFRLNAAWQEAAKLRSSNTIVGARLLKSEHRSIGTRMSIAASVVAVVAATILASINHYKPDVHVTEIGELRTFRSDDGSTITLNTNTEVGISFTRDARRVELRRGEAYFEVSKDTKRPFVVTVVGQRVIAVGTAFSVRREGNGLQALISEGKVRVEIAGSEATAPLPAGSVIRVRDRQLDIESHSTDDLEKRLSWRSGLLTFRDTPLSEAVAEFNRYNERQITIVDSAVAGIEIGGVFQTRNQESFVTLLQEGFPVRATIRGDSILLSSK